jgi:hypothetical protein
MRSADVIRTILVMGMGVMQLPKKVTLTALVIDFEMPGGIR